MALYDLLISGEAASHFASGRVLRNINLQMPPEDGG